MKNSYKKLNTYSERRALYATSVCLLGLLIIDVFNFALRIYRGEYSIATYEGLAGGSIIKFVVFSMLAVSIISIILRAVLSAKGMAEAKNPSKARFHIGLAKLAFILNGIATIGLVMALFDSTATKGDIPSLIICIADAGIMLLYAYEANKVCIK